MMKLSMIQMTSVLGKTEDNLKKILGFVSDAADSDIICFPEMSLNGYSSKVPDDLLMDADDDHIQKIRDAATASGTTVVFGFAERSGDRRFITQAVAGSDGSMNLYRKTHLGKFERDGFDAGDSFLTVKTKNAVIGIELCSECHFPEISTILALRGAEIILAPHASPLDASRRVGTWNRYLPARAYDNGVFAAACNAVPGGGVLILDPKGNRIAEDSAGKDSCVTVALDLDRIERTPMDNRKTMKDIDFLGSRRPELYSELSFRSDDR
jgi:predicted amidohydrolase